MQAVLKERASSGSENESRTIWYCLTQHEIDGQEDEGVGGLPKEFSKGNIHLGMLSFYAVIRAIIRNVRF